MKKIFIVLTGFILVNLSAYSQKFSNAQFTLFSYSLTVDPLIETKLSEFDSYISCAPPDGATKVKTMLVHSVFGLVKDKMESTFSLTILPTNSYMNNVSYDIFGYPETIIQKAIKKGDTKYYLRIIASIKMDDIYRSPDSLNATTIKPIVDISIQIFNKDGYVPIKTIDGKSTALRPLKIKPALINELNFVDLSDITNILPNETIRKEIIEAINIAISKI